MNLPGLNVRLERQYDDFGIGMYVWIKEAVDTYSIPEPVRFTTVNGPMPSIKSLFSVNDPQLQVMLDDLWRLGFRPSKEVYGGPGEIEAIKGHLNDMRKLVSAAYERVTLG